MKICYVLTAINAERVREHAAAFGPFDSFAGAAYGYEIALSAPLATVQQLTFSNARTLQVRAAEMDNSGEVLTRYFDTAGNDAPELQRLNLACAVLHWARTPGEHGGNPYAKDFVKLARQIVGDE
jgi:hypothetical protein